jgi:hypothetical protein
MIEADLLHRCFMFRTKAKKITFKRLMKWSAGAIVLLMMAALIGHVFYFFTIKALPSKGESLNTSLIHDLLYYIENPEMREENGIVIDNDYIIEAIIPTKKYLDNRYDCSDFMTPTLLRLMYKHGDFLQERSPKGYALIKETLLNFKYWMTEPGTDSMCYWSENHQILFAVAEYLAGKLWPDEIFTNDGTSGKAHMLRAEKRINYWMEHRFYFGFSEFYSTNYMGFNLGPMANFIEFSDNGVMVERMKMIMDLALYDIASNLYQYACIAPTARAYSYNLAGAACDNVYKFTEYLWNLGEEWKSNPHRMLINFISMMKGSDKNGNKYYEMPEVLEEIGRNDSTGITKSSVGLDLSELKAKGLIGGSDEQIMAQWGMESFTNPETFQNTLQYINDHDMLKNSFINYFKYISFPFMRKGNLAGKISQKYNPMTNGIVLERANIYSYGTPYYQFSTAQNYHPGTYGATQFLSVATLGGNAVAFTSHPAKYFSAKNATSAPGYWVGYGRAPSSVQYENIQLSIYKLPEKSGFLEFYDVPQFTHTYLPEAYFDEVILSGNHAFARAGDAYLSLTGASELYYMPFDIDSAKAFDNKLEDYPDRRFDLVQDGLNQYWIYELSDASKETFSAFIERISSNSVSFDGSDNLVYTSSGNTYSLTYDSSFSVNGAVQELQYKRFDSPYSCTEREADIIVFEYKGYSLTLDWKNAIRTIG